MTDHEADVVHRTSGTQAYRLGDAAALTKVFDLMIPGDRIISESGALIPSAGSLVVVTGPPGAGKTTVAQMLADRLGRSVLVQGDAFFSFLRSSFIEPWLASAQEQNTVVIEAAARTAGRFAEGGFATVYDGVVGPWFLPRFAAATRLRRLDYVVLLPSLERCIKRVRGRTDHGFRDETATRHMHDEFTNTTIEPRHVVADPPERVDAVVEIIMRKVADGALNYEAAAD